MDLESSPVIGRITADPERHRFIQRQTEAVRLQSFGWIEALPIATGIATVKKNHIEVMISNALYRRIDTEMRARGRLIERAGAVDRLRAVLTGASPAEYLIWRDGDAIDGRHYAMAITPFGPLDTAEPKAMVTLIDRTSEVRTEQSLRSEMLTDALTGLPNRAGFVERLEARIDDEGIERIGVVVVDLARFSRVNACIGTMGGDELIMTVARRLLSTLRGYDRLARTGANEFGIVVKIVDGPGDILHVARRVQHALATPCRLTDFEIKVDCAIGCALPRADGETADALMRHAQVALKAAKTTRRIEVYQPSVLAATRRRFSLETELRHAIDQGQLRLAFQPLISLKTGKLNGFEALARWNHPDLGDVSPVEFIAVAEDSGLIMPLGRWALDTALGTLAGWDAGHGSVLPIHISVNLSPIQIACDDVAGAVTERLQHYHLTGNRLELEVTESAVIADPERAVKVLDALKATNALVAMDDFGTGFSNLAALQRLPIDTLKIDRSFITDMLGDHDKQALVRAILSLAEALGMETTAEGIETDALAQALRAIGCTTGQGYLFARPLNAEDALAYVQASLA